MQGFRASHAAVVALLSVVTALSMLYCHSEFSCVCFHDRAPLSSAQAAVVAAYQLVLLGADWNRARRLTSERRFETVFAGFLLISIFNTLLILVLGTVPDESDGVVYRKGTTASAAGPNRGVATPAAGATIT